MYHSLYSLFHIHCILLGYDDDTSLNYVPKSTSSDVNMDLTLEHFTSFKITTKNASVWACDLLAVPHLWVSICNCWYLSLAPLFSKESLDVSNNCASVEANPLIAS
jgi:hypothetical protein